MNFYRIALLEVKVCCPTSNNKEYAVSLTDSDLINYCMIICALLFRT